MREVSARLQAETTFLLLRVNKIGCWQNLKRSRVLMHGSNGRGKAKILMIGRPDGNDLPPINAHIVHLQDSSSFITLFERRAAATPSTVTSTAQPVDIDGTPRKCTQANQISCLVIADAATRHCHFHFSHKSVTAMFSPTGLPQRETGAVASRNEGSK